MAILKKGTEREVIDLTGIMGSTFYLLGRAKSLAKQLELDHKAIIEEMQSSDYEHLIATFNKYFGEFVDLER